MVECVKIKLQPIESSVRAKDVVAIEHQLSLTSTIVPIE